ncbi:MAG: metallophosphoesterase [Planctomycetota bacterium]
MQLLCIVACLVSLVRGPHEGPDPVLRWALNARQLVEGRLKAALGPDGRVEGSLSPVADELGESLRFDGRRSRVVVADDLVSLQSKLPRRHLTVAVWASVDSPQPWGSFFGTIQDNGDHEKGWTLGYDQRSFTFALASKGANDGNGLLTYLRGKTQYEEGRLYHVVGTYDGEAMRLYVNGELEATSSVQSGDVLYPAQAPVTIGGYVDANEAYSHHGRIRSIEVYGLAARAAWVRQDFEHARALAESAPQLWLDPEHRWVVRPYLQLATQDGITVAWETSRPSTSSVRYGSTDATPESLASSTPTRLHAVRLEGLEAGKQYFYRVRSVDDQGRPLESDVLSFQTAAAADQPFSFCVLSDTQDNPEVAGQLAEMAFAQRPSFVLHPGDLVGTGSLKTDWTEEFFPSLRPLIERVPLYPVLGNHEEDARYFYDYFALPEPEYYYSFRYGNAELFLLDSNREVGPGSEQYAWLERELAASEATWKILCHHHPAYTSDENDYGDLWTGPSSHGDLRVRRLAELVDRFGVDLVWNGHIHSYERTWPLRDGRATQPGEGAIYLITGGGGGSLERSGPHPPWFQNNVRQGHHYCYVAVNGKTLELKAFDLEGRLFDRLVLRKP